MIKIRIAEIDKLQQEYDLLLHKSVADRLAIFDIVLGHIVNKGSTISKKVDAKIRAATKKILSIMLDEKVDKKEFEGKKFAGAVQKHASIALLTMNVNFSALKAFLQIMGDQKSGKLKLLLTCPPEQLERHNINLISNYNLGPIELKLLSIPFNYDANEEISGLIKDFFRTKNLVKYCPYCNQDPAMYSGLSNGKTVRVHQLDHFYDKAKNPLLSYSLFNLVPGDWNCNSLNKRDIPFTFDGHLNPYVEGFGADMTFDADNIGTLRRLSKINLNISSNVDKKKRKRMIGDLSGIDETHKVGNINVFALESKYNDAHVVSEADKVQRLFIDTGNNLASLKDFMAKIPVTNAYDRYIEWYELAVRAPFEEANFNDQRYSKLFRDLHDGFFLNDTQPHNEMIRSLIGTQTA